MVLLFKMALLTVVSSFTYFPVNVGNVNVFSPASAGFFASSETLVSGLSMNAARKRFKKRNKVKAKRKAKELEEEMNEEKAKE